jgi:hypothetical protein
MCMFMIVIKLYFVCFIHNGLYFLFCNEWYTRQFLISLLVVDITYQKLVLIEHAYTWRKNPVD